MTREKESYRVATNKNSSSAKPKKGKKQKAADLEDLKKEVEIVSFKNFKNLVIIKLIYSFKQRMNTKYHWKNL
jgi:hypothetical protein